MEKKKLLFVIDSLGIGGAEKSLVTLLSLLDYDKYEVDLQLFAYGGVLEQFVPKEVNILPPFDYYQKLSKGVVGNLSNPSYVYNRIKYSLLIRQSGLTHADKARLYWQSVGRCLNITNKKYDAAIAYAQGVPTFYVVDKVKAKKKFGWVNVDYKLQGVTKDFQRAYYQSLDKIVTVSDSSYDYFSSQVYPELKDNMTIIWDINDAGFMQRMSQMQSDKPIRQDTTVIMTSGRYNKPQKGYDLALEAAKILRDRGVKFCWYAVGEGPYRAEMEKYIVENDLQDHFVLLGKTPNPYAYIRQCDIYVQTSRHEGFGLTIAEARILNRPVVCTNFDGCTMQMVDGENGLITSFEPSDIADNIMRLMNDKELYNHIQQYQMQEKKGNTEEIEKFYTLING